MSSYLHDIKKLADTGLQLRLPVDLVPATQYSRFTNALPIIEGQLRTRDGLTLVGSPAEVVFINTIATIASPTAVTINTIYPHGAVVGQIVIVNILYIDPTDAHSAILGSSAQTISAVPSTTSITVAPGILTTLPGAGTVKVFAQLILPSVLSTLTNTPINNLFRLNQAISGLNGDRIATLNGRIFKASLPAGADFEELVGPRAPGSTVPTQVMGFSGRPISIIEFRFTKDTASWALFADQNQMYKYRPGTQESALEFCQLGNAPPLVSATASAGGVGNLDSTGGTDYDWRYTYVDGYALTESNPSPIDMSSGGGTTTRPTSFTNPAVAGDVAFLNPANAYDGSTTTASTGSAGVTSSGGTSTSAASCIWKGWAAAAAAVSSIQLNVTASATFSGTADPMGASASADVAYSYSYDAGVSWHTLANPGLSIGGGQTLSSSTGKQTYTAVIPSAIALTNIQVRAVATAEASGIAGGGPFPTQTASCTVSASIYDINTNVVEAGAVNGLALVNQIGIVCVTPSPYPQHKFINLYRRGGSLPDAWRLVGQFQQSTLVIGVCGAGTVEIDDNISDTELSTAAILQLDNDQPVTSVTIQNQALSFIWGPVGLDARVLGCGDPARPESVYFSKPGNADAWPPQNFVEVSSPGTPVIAGCVFNTRTFAFTRESIYELVEGLGTGTTFAPFRTPSAHGLYSPWALAIGPAMYFVAKDGIYMSTGGQETSIVENDIKPLFPTYDTPGESVHGYEAIDMSQSDAMRLRYHNDELYFAYVGRDTGTRQMLVYDLLKKRWRAAVYTNGISEVYSEPATISSLLMGTTPGQVWLAGGPVDPSALDLLENVSISQIAGTGAVSASFFRAVRYDNGVPAAISYEVNAVIDLTHVVQVTFPRGKANTTSWRVFYGPIAGGENWFQQYTESLLPANRTVTISVVGTVGVLPTVNSDNTIHGLVRTGAHDQGVPLNQKQYGNVIFDLDPGGSTNAAPVTITPLVNGEVQTKAALTITGTGRQQVPLDLSDFFAFNTEYEIAWSRSSLGAGIYADPQFFQYDTLHFLEPVQVTHWESQPTSFAFPGFAHCRDSYIAIRSNAPVTLTMTFDAGAGAEVVQTYTLASTAGERRKQYVQFRVNKGLLYRFSLDSEASFRVYEQDIETRVKPWLGVLGYSVQRVLGGEANA